jgi:hypothetical protein
LADGKVYVAQAGFIQFDPVERDANNKQVVEFTIKCVGKPINVRVTLWPELTHAKVEKGDFVAVEGTFTRSTYQGEDGSQKESLQISAYNLNVNGERIERNESEREIVSSSATGDNDDLPF